MRNKSIVLFVLTLFCGGLYWWLTEESGPRFEIEEGFTPLLQSGSLQGWSPIGGGATFEANGDEVTGRHGPGKNTFLRTDKTYGDFILRMQMRWDEPGNSGVLFRSHQYDGDGKAYGYQYELDSSERAWSGGIYDESRRGWIASLEDNEEARKAIRLNDWNDIQIEARGASLKTWINGVPAADIVDGLDAEGFIALQIHSGDAGVVRWRRIRIKELAQPGHPGEGLAQSSDWLADGVSELVVDENRLQGVFSAEVGRITARRQLADVITRMQLPACDQATVVRMRQTRGEGTENLFAQLKVFAARAEVIVRDAAGEHRFEAVTLGEAPRHEVTWVTFGDALTITVDGQDVARLKNMELQPRGQFVLEPAHCGESFEISEFSWTDLRQKSSEDQFYQTLDNEPAPVLEPREALESFRLAPGFEVELVAAEPLVEDPVAMAWDEYGRLYVVEMRSWMPDAYGVGHDEPIGQVVRLEDIDGDGRMDRSEVFLGGLVNPRAVAVVNEGILIAEPPHLWLCELSSAADLCENKRIVSDYAPDVATANVEHLENRLLQGLDNWLYNAKSSRRHKFDADGMQVEDTIFRGQWGIGKDNYGRLFYNHNSTWIQADLFAAEDLVSSGYTRGAFGLGVNLTEESEVFSIRVNPGVNRAYLEGTLRPDGRLHRATGVSGLEVYRGDQFPRSYHGNVFVPEAAANVVAQFSLKEEGMELAVEHALYEDETWGQREFLASTDERFRPVDVSNGPDGALYVIDMYRGIIQDQHYLTDELREQIFQRNLDEPLGRGRIWAVRHAAGSAKRTFPELAKADDAKLVAALAHPNGWVRDTAQRLIIANDGQMKDALAHLATGGETIAAIHALWALQGRGELERELVLEVAKIDDPQRQLQVLRAGRELLQTDDVLALDDLMRDAPEVLRMQLAFVMGDHVANEQIRQGLQNALATALESTYVSQAVIRAVAGRELEFLREMRAGGLFVNQSAAMEHILATLAGNAYKSLRGDLTSPELAKPGVRKAVHELLDFVESRSAGSDWQQLAMLAGIAELTSSDSFQPVLLETVPSLFTDGTIGEENPLWPARLAARHAFTWPGDELALGITPLSPQQLLLMVRGEAFYPRCGACHGAAGEGTASLAPALANSPWVTGPPEWLGRIILQGMSGPVEIDGKVWDGVMPSHGQLKDLDDGALAGLMTYMRRSWGNKANPVTAEQVSAIRSASSGRNKPWTVDELESVAVDRGFGRFIGKYSISFVTLTISEDRDGLHLKIPMYGSGQLTQLSERVFDIDTGDKRAKIEFIVEADGSVGKLLLSSGAEIMTATRKQD